MPAERTEALVIRGVDFSETSRVLTLFTRDFGKLSVIAKGGRRLRGPFEVSLDLLSLCSISVIRKSSGGLDVLTEALLRERFTGLRDDLQKLYAAYFLAELLDATTL
ncbi:MAG: DNA repair protein RecO, partial [Planctomycetia bacterium]